MISGSLRVDVERVLVPDRLRRVALVDRVGIDAARAIDERAAVLAEPADDDVGGERRQVADRAHAVVGQRDGRLLADAPQPGDRERRQERRLVAAARTTTSPSGLRRSDAIFATSLVVATPTETVSPTSSRTRGLDQPRDGLAVAEQLARAGDVEERLVDRDRLDLRREPAEDRHDVARRLLVAPAVDRQEHAVRAAPDRLVAATSPSGRRTVAPRSSPPTRPRGRADRHRR